ncbi:NAD(P)/FAD-dependent oxidoreductase [Sphingobacterium sp. ML3W]|uniref:phytoene desaturase family protein n=1 Tax=Sphingobacterium sp. ML3W TaxID=1538644 RepID=UPI002499BC27|nr:NAD(P)/FAD-dependent oxidoreductase [Sphingobacterium sp. ML3W]WFA80088.1 NAD(P)/FAD-dependent oxidoreductase [Sphingobacterium sp. ML3W]
MGKVYDSVIIGSGLGGLVTAVLLARFGRKVCVIEKNNQYGGNLQTFVRDKEILDTGVHYIGGLGEGENLYKYFDYLGIMQDLAIQRMDIDEYDRISFEGDPINYPHAQGYDNFINQLLPYFPEEEEALRNYCKKIQEICNSFPMYNLRKSFGFNETVLGTSLKSFLDELTDNELLKAVLVGSNFLYVAKAESTPLYVHALTINSYIQSAWRCINGGSQIAKLLIRQLRKYGGDILKNKEVIAVEMEDQLIKAVRTDDQQLIYANEFVSNINLRHTFAMLPERFQKQAYVKRIHSLPLSPSVFSVYIVCKDDLIPYQNYNIYHYKNIKSVWYDHDQSPLVISMSRNDQDQTFCSTMTVMCYMMAAEVQQWDESFNRSIIQQLSTRGDSYEAFKTAKANQIIEELQHLFPNIKDAIRSVHTSSPLTYRDFIGAEEGNMYGYLKEHQYPLNSLISTKTKVKNLFLTGQNVKMHGVLGVTITAFSCCLMMLGKEFEDDLFKENDETAVANDLDTIAI